MPGIEELLSCHEIGAAIHKPGHTNYELEQKEAVANCNFGKQSIRHETIF